MKTELIYLFILVLAVTAISGCTTSSPAVTPTVTIAPTTATPVPPTSTAVPTTASTPSPTAAAPSSVSVSISGFAFQPAEVTIAKGGTVAWTNNDGTTHTVKFQDSESPGLQQGKSYSKTFDTTGTFDYSCGIHPSMKGKVIVV